MGKKSRSNDLCHGYMENTSSNLISTSNVTMQHVHVGLACEQCRKDERYGRHEDEKRGRKIRGINQGMGRVKKKMTQKGNRERM